MSFKFFAVGLLSVLVAAQGMALPLEVQQDDPVPLKNWSAAPFWVPDAGDQAAVKGSGMTVDSISTTTILPYVSITPCRLIDTRAGSGFAPSWGSPSLAAGVDPDPNSLTDDRLFPATLATSGNPCGIPAGARAIAANVTAWQFTANGKILLYSGSDAVRPTTATVNYRLFTTPAPAANLAQAYAIIPLDGAGKFLAFSNKLVDLIVDVNGYYAPTGIVNSMNSLTGDLSLVAGTNVTVTPSGTTITIATSVPSGPSGPSGPEGPTGAQGLSGPSGPSGAQGVSGPSGPSGAQGLSGPSGPSGAQGLSGPSGPSGAQGLSGPSGPSGAQGLSGPSGPSGPMGIQGLSGPSGPSGPSGATGSTSVYFGTTGTVSGTAITTPHIVSGIIATVNGTVTVTFSGAAAFTSATSYACTVRDSAQLTGTSQSVVSTQAAGSIGILSSQVGTARYVCVGN